MPLLSSFGAMQAIGRGPRGSRKSAVVTIAANIADYVANTSKVSGYEPGMDITFVIDAGVTVGSTSTSSHAFTVDTSWDASDSIQVIVNGGIVGRGGAGGASNGAAGGAGGPAFRAQRAVTIQNNGKIASGGRGGTAGAQSCVSGLAPCYGCDYSGKNCNVACWGSCGSVTYCGNGGAGGKAAGAEGSGEYAAGAGNAGSYSGAIPCTGAYTYGGTGATGGALGDAAYITGNSFVTWSATGTRIGSVA